VKFSIVSIMKAHPGTSLRNITSIDGHALRERTKSKKE